MNATPSDSAPVLGNDFSRCLRTWRQDRGLDLDAASRLLGVSGNYLYMIERGVHAPSTALVGKLAELQGELTDSRPAVIRRIPVLSWVQAGKATSYEEEPADWVEWTECLCPDPQAFAVRVVGESMLPKYRPGSLVVCMPGYPPKNNGLVVAKIHDDEATFKKVSFKGTRPERYRLVPLNPQYHAVEVAREDVTWIYPVYSVLRPAGG